MFGMTLEKMLVVLVVTAMIIGPHRLPAYAHRLAALVRTVRTLTETARSHVERETGVPLAVDEWRALDPRQYDPRRIVRDALAHGQADAADPPDTADSDAEAARARAAAIRAAQASPGGWRPAPASAAPAPSDGKAPAAAA